MYSTVCHNDYKDVLLLLDILLPIVLLDEAKQFLDLSISQWRLDLSHLPGNRYIRRLLLQELGSIDAMKCDGIIGRIEYLIIRNRSCR
jgi:hypothetical protein